MPDTLQDAFNAWVNGDSTDQELHFKLMKALELVIRGKPRGVGVKADHRPLAIIVIALSLELE